MDQDEFWAIVAESRARAGGQILGQTAALHELLSTRPLDDVLAFQRHLVTALDRAGTTDLAHAAGLLLGGVGDDSFQDFRTWLLCHGREVFERARWPIRIRSPSLPTTRTGRTSARRSGSATSPPMSTRSAAAASCPTTRCSGPTAATTACTTRRR